MFNDHLHEGEYSYILYDIDTNCGNSQCEHLWPYFGAHLTTDDDNLEVNKPNNDDTIINANAIKSAFNTQRTSRLTLSKSALMKGNTDTSSH